MDWDDSWSRGFELVNAFELHGPAGTRPAKGLLGVGKDAVMSYLPLKYWTDFDLKCTLEYPVSDFAAELRWMKEVVGFTLLSESEDYAIVTDAGHHLPFRSAVRRAPAGPERHEPATLHR